MNILNNRNRNTSINNAAANNSGVENPAEYWCNLVFIYDEVSPETGKNYTMQLPNAGFPLDRVIEGLRANVPSSKATLTEFKWMLTRGANIADNLLEFAQSIEVGEHGLFLLGAQEINGELVKTQFALEIYHKDLKATKMTLSEAETKFQVRKLYIPGKTA